MNCADHVPAQNSLLNQMSGQQKHICFYSTKCRHSQTFLQELRQTRYAKEFTFICVDPAPDRPKLPAWLKSVPTIVIDKESEPRTDSSVMNWLYEKKLRDSSNTPGSAALPNGVATLEPESYNLGEMSSSKWSDSYSFFDDAFSVANGQGQDRISKQFFQLNGGENNPNPAGLGDSGVPIKVGDQPNLAGIQPPKQMSKKEEALVRQFEQFQLQRDRDIPGPQNRK